MANLTDKQEMFARELVAGKTQYAAYLCAYPGSDKWKRAQVDSKASVLAKMEKIQARMEVLRAPVARRLQYTLETAMDEAMQAFEIARDDRQSGSMVAAAALRAKLQGFMIEKREIAVTQMGSMAPSDKQYLLDEANRALAERKRLAMGDVTDVEAKP